MPLVYSSEIVDPSLAPRLIHLAVFCLILVITYIFGGNNIDCPIIRNKRLLLLPSILLIFVFVSFISLAQARVISEGYFTVSRLLTSSLFLFITAILLIQQKISIQRLIKSVFWFALISSLIAIYQILNSNSNDIATITGTMGNKNLLSSILFLTIPFLFLVDFEKQHFKIIKYIAIGLLVFILIYVRTRAVLIPLVFTLLLYGFYHLLKLFNKHSFRILSITMIGSILLALFSVLTLQKFDILSSITSSNTLETRITLWKKTGSMISDNTLLGVGSGNWKVEFANYGINDLTVIAREGRMIYQRPHNDFLWAFAETGIIGFLAFCSLFLISILICLKLLKNSNSDSERTAAFLITLTLLGFGFISSFDFPFERIEHQVLFFTLLAIVIYKQFKFLNGDKKTKINIKLPNTIIVAFSCLLLFSLFIGIKRYQGEKNMRAIYIAHGQQEWTELEELVEKTKNDFFLLDPMSVPLDWYKGVGLFARGDFKLANNAFKDAYNLTPYNIHVLNNLASSYEKNVNRENTIKYYNEALRIAPNFEESQLNLSASYFNMKEYEKAFDVIYKVSYNCEDPKYRIFLPAIARKKLAIEIEKHNKKQIELESFSDEELINSIILSKKNNINFVSLIIN